MVLLFTEAVHDLRDKEDEVAVDRHDGIKSNIKTVTVNEMFDLWCQLKRGIKDSTMKNYVYMYELFVKPTFGKKKLWTVKKSDVRRFYNQLIDDKVMKISTVDGVHNVLQNDNNTFCLFSFTVVFLHTTTLIMLPRARISEPALILPVFLFLGRGTPACSLHFPHHPKKESCLDPYCRLTLCR